MKIVIANSNQIHRAIENQCKTLFDAEVVHKKEELASAFLEEINPEYIFFIHWSYLIPKTVYDSYRCVVFHMTDLPYGRGGSPLQNLIVRGFKETMISAIRVEGGIDTGAILMKRPLSLIGSAEEIFLRAGKTILTMIEEIIRNNPMPIPQQGKVTVFKRRTPDESNIESISDLEGIYDVIRMLDADGYPKAFLETEYFRFEFSRASLKADGIIADVKISKKL